MHPINHPKLLALFRKIHASFVQDLNTVASTNHEAVESFDVFSASLDTDMLVKKKATALDTKEFMSLEIVPGVMVKDFADKLSTIELVRTFFVYVLILAAIVEKVKDESNEDDDKLMTALQSARKGASYTYDGKEVLLTLLHNIASLNTMDEAPKPKSSKPAKPSTSNDSPLPNIDMAFLEQSKIGKIAKEISEEIDISGIKRPEDVLNFTDPKNNVIGDIVSKVGSKIHTKLNNGELKQEDLLSEAFGLLNTFGGKIPGGGNFSDILNNPMMKDMMKNMAGQFGGAAAGAGGAKAKGGAKMAVNTSKLREMSARERLRSKLKKRDGEAEADNSTQ